MSIGQNNKIIPNQLNQWDDYRTVIPAKAGILAGYKEWKIKLQVSLSNLNAYISQKIRLPAEIRKFRLPRPSRQAIVAGGQTIQNSSG